MINHEEILLRWWQVDGGHWEMSGKWSSNLGWYRVLGYSRKGKYLLAESWIKKEKFQNMEWCVIPEEVRDVKLYQPS